MKHIISMICILLTNSILPCTCITLAYLDCYTMAGFALVASIFVFTPFSVIKIESSNKESSKDQSRKLTTQKEV